MRYVVGFAEMRNDLIANFRGAAENLNHVVFGWLKVMAVLPSDIPCSACLLTW